MPSLPVHRPAPRRPRVRLLGLVALAAATGTTYARAGDWDLNDDPPAAAQDEAAKFDAYAAAPVQGTIKAPTYDLAACLALADRNHPNIWAARARLSFVHGQLDEAKWFPYSQWNLNAGAGVLPPIYGSVYFSSSDLTQRNLGALSGLGLTPTARVSIDGLIPLYTFGKIDSAKRTAQAGVRVSEWDLEKTRQAVRQDVRRAYFGLMFSRDARFLIDEVAGRLETALKDLQAKAAQPNSGVDEFDLLRLGMYKDQIVVRRAETEKGERYALAALRFFTGVQTRFDVPDEPMKPPDTPIAPLTRYLTAARLFRPDVNMARSGIVARKSWVDYQRARYYPDIGLGISAFYSYAPSAERQTNAWTGDPFNGFGFGFFAGARWPLDFLAQSARVQQAEAQLQESRALERMALGGVGVEVENQYGIVVEAKARFDRWGHMTRTARKWIATVQDAIELGTRDARALLEPVRYYVDARSQELYALHDLNVQMSELSRLTGWDSAAPTGR